MAGTIVFTIFIKDGVEQTNSQILNLGLLAIWKGCESYSVEGGTEFRFDTQGISKISTEKLMEVSYFYPDVQCRGQIGPRFIELTDAEYNGLVQVQFPASTKTVGEGEEATTEQITFAEYCPFGPLQSADGTKWLINISERAQSETCGDGTSWEEYLIWQAAFGDRLINETQRNELTTSAAYTE